MAAIAWPACVLIIVLSAFFIFRTSINRFIDRTKAVTKDGVTTEALVPQEIGTPQKASGAEKLLKIFDNQLLVEQETLITDFLKKENVSDPAEKEKVLVRYLASAQLVNRFEAAYRRTMGSQFRALEMLNESEPQGVPSQALEAWYEVGKAGFPSWYENYTFEQWTHYMQSMVLIGVGKDGLIHITVFGIEFLKYLVEVGYTTAKNG